MPEASNASDTSVECSPAAMGSEINSRGEAASTHVSSAAMRCFGGRRDRPAQSPLTDRTRTSAAGRDPDTASARCANRLGG